MKTLVLLVGLVLVGPELLAQESMGAVKHLWHIAYQFQPQPDGEGVIPGLPIDKAAWDVAVEQAMAEDSTACTEPLLLILMRLYVAHLRCCNQSHDISNDGGIMRRSSITKAFLRLTDPAKTERLIEFYSSGAPYEYYLRHKARFKSNAIREEAKLISKETSRIRKGT